MRSRWRGLRASGAVSAGLLVLMSCSRRTEVFPNAPVFVISIDTLRADHLPAYGYRLVKTPNLDALARDAVVFENALSHVPLTLPSHASLFTGLLPFQHGVRDNLGYRLNKSHTTLASLLGARGFATGAAVSAFVLDHGSGIAQGFDFYEDSIESRDVAEAVGRVQRAGDLTERRLEEWIGKVPTGKPLFAFLHLYEPHAPYEPPEPFRSRYASSPYDGEIAEADAVVGRFLEFLKKRSLYEPAVIVFVSDHGEGLGDHGEDEHGILLYREELHVPLFIKLPRSAQAGKRVVSPAALADVFPTVTRLLGLPLPAGVSGGSLLAPGSPQTSRRVYSETVYPRYHFGWSDLAALTDDRYQYIEAPRPELYDWRLDPGEKKNLSATLPPPFRSMRLELQSMNRPTQAPGESDAETVRKLASLGYIGAARPPENARDLPDPKDRLAAIDRLKEANRLASQNRDEEAAALLRGLARENPLMLDAWESLARILRLAGRPQEALEALEQADRLSPATPPILLAMADLQRENRGFTRARALAEAARSAGARGVPEEIAAIALDEGRLEEAIGQAEVARRESPGARTPVLLLAKIQLAKGDAARALSLLDSAPGSGENGASEPLLGFQAARGDALARLGREKDAEIAFRAEIRDFPRNLDAWSRLALLYASAGRKAEFEGLLRQMVEGVPNVRAYEAAARACEIVGDRASARVWRLRAAAL